ncbi:MAG: SatD family protein [Mycobacteriales bacterium]
MAEVVVALIGDVVRSRDHEDRKDVHARLTDALERTNGDMTALQALDVTVGDEFQGAYRSVADAVRATFLVRLHLLPDIDVRCGLGRGTLTVLQATRGKLVQDGPAWWAAREAIVRSHELEAQRGGRPRTTRSWFLAAPAGTCTPDEQHLEALVNALLVCRDELLHRNAVRKHAELLRDWILGAGQDDLARRHGISQSAVSQRLTSLGGQSLREMDCLLAAAGDP